MRLCLAICLFAALAPSALAQSPAPPQASLSPEQAHVGAIEIGAPAVVSLDLRNAGGGDLRVERVVTAHRQITATAEPVPGQEGRAFKIRVSLSVTEPGRFGAWIYVRTNDPVRPDARAWVFGNMIPKEARITLLVPFALSAENSWLFDGEWVKDVVNPLHEVNQKVNERNYKEQRILLTVHDLSSGAGYAALKALEAERGERVAGPSAILAGGKLLQTLDAQRAFVRALTSANDTTLEGIRRAAEGAAR